MHIESSHPLKTDALGDVFLDQATCLYCAKVHLITNLPDLIRMATFKDLQMAMLEVLDETKKQMISLGKIFTMLDRSADTESCLAMNAVVAEAHKKIGLFPGDNYAGDMTIIFYMSVIENLQVGAGRIFNLIASKPNFKPYTQLVKETFDMSSDNASLFNVIAVEYLRG